jgi:HEAT repeat protein
LTQGASSGVDRNLTYNLGSTGMRGWIHTKPASYLDSLQGRTTAASRQILVTHVGKKSPAAGVMQVNDVILGVAGKPFNDDARKSIAYAIQDAEKDANQGILKLIRWRTGKTETVQIKLRVMGTYSATAPYDCPKSKRILEQACKVLEKEPLNENWCGAVNGLALLATGDPHYLPKVREFARKMAPKSLNLRKEINGSAWELGYRNIFLCEYYLLTRDKEVMHAITEYTLSLAMGQGMYGTFGHGFSGLTPEGKRHGAVPPYGPVNMAGLPANLGIVMGKLCGVKDPEVDAAIERADGFFGYYVDKGAIPYGEHEPWPYHENNGKNSLSAVLFALQWNRTKETQFFAKMATAGYRSRECGHTGQGFSYLWSALGANTGGPLAAAAFFKEASWHLDLVRRCDGSFTYDGGEQYGAGKTDDDTYYGNSSYSGLSPTATYVLTYSMPLQKLCITGKDANPENWLGIPQVAAAIASGSFDTDRTKKSPQELVAAFGDWSPIVRGWAAEELSKRPEAHSMVPKLIDLAEGKDAHVSQGACEALGEIKSKRALPALVRLLSHDDRWVRFKAAQAIKKMGAEATPELPDILKAVALTAEPIYPVNWADPVQLTHGQLAAALFAGGLTDALKDASPKLRYPAIQVACKIPDGMARATLRGYFENKLTEKDVQVLAPDLLAAIKTMCPADTMFGAEIRMGAFKALTKYHYKEGIDAGVIFAQTQGGHGSESRTGEIMKELESYGAAARDAVPQLKELLAAFNDQCKAGEFPAGELNDRRTGAVAAAIKSIQAAKDQPKLKTIAPGRKS